MVKTEILLTLTKAANKFNCGISLTHGAHQVAQKFTIKPLPLKFCNEMFLPVTVEKVFVGKELLLTVTLKFVKDFGTDWHSLAFEIEDRKGAKKEKTIM